MNVATAYDYGSKYAHASLPERLVLGNFFRTAGAMIRRLDIASALEVGCGEGYSTRRLSRLLPPGTRFEASDVEQRLVDATRAQNPAVPVSSESIYRLQRETNAVDLVICLEVLEHLENPAAALRELTRVSRRYLLLSVPREPLFRAINMARLKYVKALGNTPGHIQHWSASQFQRLVAHYAEPVKTRRPVPWTLVLARV